jgi:cytoskeletal protein CcmA (bactofilin family)
MFTAKTSGKGAAPEASRANGKSADGKTAMPSIISVDLSITGDLASAGDIQIDGAVEGDVKTQTLTIGETGSVKGAIEAETVLVAGKVAGQIRAKTISLGRTARVEGDIWHDSLSIEAGAQFEGSCRRLGTAAAPPAQPEVTNWSAGKRKVAVASNVETLGGDPRAD